jgi:hypothetical protein
MRASIIRVRHWEHCGRSMGNRDGGGLYEAMTSRWIRREHKLTVTDNCRALGGDERSLNPALKIVCPVSDSTP